MVHDTRRNESHIRNELTQGSTPDSPIYDAFISRSRHSKLLRVPRASWLQILDRISFVLRPKLNIVYSGYFARIKRNFVSNGLKSVSYQLYLPIDGQSLWVAYLTRRTLGVTALCRLVLATRLSIFNISCKQDEQLANVISDMYKRFAFKFQF